MKQQLYIKLYPSLNKSTGSQNATTIMGHLEYWFEKMPDGFYKFIEPCAHRLYKEGDSWTEVLGMNRMTFTRAIKKITTRYNSRTAFEYESDPFQGKFYASYYDRHTNQTYFIRNHLAVDSLLKQIRSKSNVKSTEILSAVPTSKLANLNNVDSTKCSIQTEQNVRSLIYTNNTSEKNTSHAEPIVLSKPSSSQPLLEPSMQNEIVKKMIEIWNAIVEEGRECILLTNKRTAFLKKAFSDAFQEKLDNWKQYCEKIASSQFLMGKVNAFKATLDFALKFETIQKISEGQYGVKEIAQYVSHVNPSDMAIQIKSSNESEKIRSFRLGIMARVGASTYKSWFSSIKFEENENHIITMNTQSSFIKDYISQHYRGHLKSLMENLNIESVILSKNGNGRDEIIMQNKKDIIENILKDELSLNSHDKDTTQEENSLIKIAIKEFLALSKKTAVPYLQQKPSTAFDAGIYNLEVQKGII